MGLQGEEGMRVRRGGGEEGMRASAPDHLDRARRHSEGHPCRIRHTEMPATLPAPLPRRSSYSTDYKAPLEGNERLRSPNRNEDLAITTASLKDIYFSAFNRVGECVGG